MFYILRDGALSAWCEKYREDKKMQKKSMFFLLITQKLLYPQAQNRGRGRIRAHNNEQSSWKHGDMHYYRLWSTLHIFAESHGQIRTLLHQQKVKNSEADQKA